MHNIIHEFIPLLPPPPPPVPPPPPPVPPLPLASGGWTWRGRWAGGPEPCYSVFWNGDGSSGDGWGGAWRGTFEALGGRGGGGGGGGGEGRGRRGERGGEGGRIREV